MPRALISPIIKACVEVAGTAGVPVGDGGSPGCPPPYIVVISMTSPRYDGPADDAEADSSDRIQFAYIGETREQADSVRDKLRLSLTASALSAIFVTNGDNRRCLNVILDIPRGTQRDDRGLPNPIYSGIDQYLIDTTPFTP